MLGPSRLGTLVCGAALISLTHASGNPRAAWPNGPFVTSERWITDASGSNVAYAGVNWPGHGETMVPEGLQHQSVSAIVDKIKSLGMNVIRLTYAIEMIDQIEDNGGDDIPIQTAFIDALGKENGTAVYEQVVANNPSFDSATTRLQVVTVASLYFVAAAKLTSMHYRFLTPSRTSVQSRRFTFILIITSLRLGGVALRSTVMRGGETSISLLRIGLGVSPTWRTT